MVLRTNFFTTPALESSYAEGCSKSADEFLRYTRAGRVLGVPLRQSVAFPT